MKTKAILFCLLAFSVLFSCRSTKKITEPPIVLTNTDSVRTVYIETVTIDTVKVAVPIPTESAKQIVKDIISHLETSLALSDAWINPDGTLGHSIANKPGKFDSEVLVPHKSTTNEKEIIKEKEIPVPEPYPVEIERNRTFMEQVKLAAFWYLLGAVVVSLCYIFRKPLLITLRKIMRL